MADAPRTPHGLVIGKFYPPHAGHHLLVHAAGAASDRVTVLVLSQDFTDAAGQRVDRLTAVKEVLDDFLAQRKGDRVGLIFFGSAAFVRAPFTEDLDACRTLLDEAQVRMAGPKTAFGDAIGLALTVPRPSAIRWRRVRRSSMRDADLIARFASELSPAIMPRKG